MNIVKIIIKDSGTMTQPDPMKPGKWDSSPRIREFDTIAAIMNPFDREHVSWMIENEQTYSRLGERHYELIEE